MYHPKKTRPTSMKVHSSKQEVPIQMQEAPGQVMKSMFISTVQKPGMNLMITSKEQILSSYPDIFDGISRFPGLQYHIQVDPNITLKQTPCRPIPIHFKRSIQEGNRQNTESRYYQTS